MRGSFEAFYSELSGDWQLTRKISDGSRFEGSARFVEISENSFCLEETGRLVLQNSVSLNAMREWQWIYCGNGLLDIRYSAKNGGGVYHQVELSALENTKGQSWHGEAIHHCGNDVYAGSYQLAENCLKIRHEINGPKKDLVIKSHFFR
ncbi:MAG: DUF6314 family protein [Pseudomonadota bacterium]